MGDSTLGSEMRRKGQFTLASLTLALEAVCIVELLSSHFPGRERIDVRNEDLRAGETEEEGDS